MISARPAFEKNHNAISGIRRLGCSSGAWTAIPLRRNWAELGSQHKQASHAWGQHVSGAINPVGKNPSTVAWWISFIHRHPLALLAAAGVVGIAASNSLGDHSSAPWVVSAVAIGLAVPRLAKRRWLAAVLLFVPVFAIRHLQERRVYQSASILTTAGSIGQPSVIEGVIDKPVTRRRHPLADQIVQRGGTPWQTHLEIRVSRFRVGHQFRARTGRVLVVCDGKRDDLFPGDRVRVYGTLLQFGPPTNPGQRDLRSVYRRRHLHARLNVDAPEQIERLNVQTYSLMRVMAAFAARSRELLLHHVGPETSPLAVALVIGQRDYVDRQTRDLLLVTGTAHLMSVSGLHLAIIVLMARWLVTLLPISSTLKIVCVIVLCLLYTAMTGARPPVVRASVLVVAMMISILVRRPSQPLNTLALAGLLLLGYNPELLFSVGVQLSFLAVATLLLCGGTDRHVSRAVQDSLDRERQLETLVHRASSRPVRWLRVAITKGKQLGWFSLCVTTVSMPLVWHQFHVVSPISVIANVVLGPMLFLALGSGVLTVIGGWIAAPLAAGPASVCDLSLRTMRWTIETAASIPYGHFWLPSPPTWLVICFYFVLAASLYWHGRAACRLRYVWIVLWITIAYFAATRPASLPAGTVEATFVDVGHGTSVVIRFADDEVWLYDCGRLGNDVGSSRDIDTTLWALGTTRLHGIFLSHADADHYNALPGILRRFAVDRIVTAPGMLAESEEALESVRQAISRYQIPVVECSAADPFRPESLQRSAIDEVRFRVLHPPADRVGGNDNANSLVLQIDHSGRSLLLPGDLEPPGTEILIGQPRPPVGGILMAPHHGSVAMDAGSVLQWARPRETVVSGGQRARRPEVQEMLATTGSGVHVTALDGAIRVRIDGEGKIDVRSWRRSPW